MDKIKLGQEVKDKLTGFFGIAVSATEFLQGCRRIEVQPKVDKDGKLQELGCFDEPLLEVIGSGILVEEPKTSRGGPHRGHNPERPVSISRR